ncbi:alpha/beta-hydrolase [Trichoderma sp. SZMC 28013]
MAITTEGTFQIGDDSFYSKTWAPTGAVVAKLILVHGFSDHINCYNELFSRLTAHGIQIFAWDQRGWGRSVTRSSEKGLTGGTTRVLADVAAFIGDKLPSELPVFVMGHSAGGGTILTLAAEPQYKNLVLQIRGWILEAPLVGFLPGQEPNSITVILGRLACMLFPQKQMIHYVAPELFSQDTAIVESIRNDPLRHNTGTLEGLAGLLDRTMALSSGKTKMGRHVQSVLLMHGTSDRSCSYDSAVEWLDRQETKDKTVKSYEGAYHQLHMDLCLDEFSKDLAEWILQRSVSTEQSEIISMEG